ncbi:MAG: hypothetical protein C0391_02180 [Anaerolinea sp.]|nr:hypothetical protein [Anaerolinea sp.]
MNHSGFLNSKMSETIYHLLQKLFFSGKNRGRGIRFASVLLLVAILPGNVQGAAPFQTKISSTTEEYSRQTRITNPHLLSPNGQAQSDRDRDGLSDDLEYYLATTYAPVLIFDEDEQENVSQTLIPLYQVSPLRHYSGQDGAMLVFTFLYDNDNGADLDQEWSIFNMFDDACSLIMDPFDQMTGTHCGDTESIYFFIGQWDNWQTTHLNSIYWKRHYDPIYETSAEVVAYRDFSGGTNYTHPVIYVSEDKHGMYPSHDECEDYETHVIQDETYIPCTPKMEDCSGGVQLQITNLPPQWNVGESISESTMNTTALEGTHYQGYNPWENIEFAGRTDYEKLCTALGGGLGGKWCGSPFAGEGHPCSGSNWWGKVNQGSCMNYNMDRFGSDYRMIEMSGPDPDFCRQACEEDPACVSFSYVRPGFQVANARCYLKNSAPPSYFNECCVSGLRDDCLDSGN